MEHIRVARSFIASDALAELISREYDFGGPVSCKLFSKMLRSQDNDHYKVTTKDGRRFVARVYQRAEHLERKASDYQYELDWLNFLKERNLPVSYPIQQRDGGFLGSLLAPEGVRYYALFSLAKGVPMSADNLDHLYICGQQMAQIHLASNAYSSPYQRHPMNLEFLLEKPLERIHRFWKNDPDKQEDLELITISAEEARAELEELFTNPYRTEDGWGPIGGDFHAANTHFDVDNNPTFFNFDLCGPGWRAYDIATFLLNTDLMHKSSAEPSESFFAGYYSVRPLSQNEHEAISPFLTVRRVWLTSLFTVTDGLAGHTFLGPA